MVRILIYDYSWSLAFTPSVACRLLAALPNKETNASQMGPALRVESALLNPDCTSFIAFPLRFMLVMPFSKRVAFGPRFFSSKVHTTGMLSPSMIRSLIAEMCWVCLYGG